MGSAVYKDTFVSERGGFGGGGSRSSAAVNNPMYSGGSVSSASGSSVGSTTVVGSKTLTNYNASNLLTNITTVGVGTGLVYYTDEELAAMNESERAVAEQNESLQKAVEAQADKVKTVEQKNEEIASGVTYEQGQALPSVLASNAKALTLSINSLTSVIAEQFSLLNNYMMGNLMYQQQFLDIKTEESGLKIESMQYNKSTQTVYDLDGNALGKAAPRDLTTQKDAVVAIDHTDKINFNLDDDGDIDDVADGIDLSSILGYNGDTDVVKELFEKLGGQGL